jgi:hypothetical protein
MMLYRVKLNFFDLNLLYFEYLEGRKYIYAIMALNTDYSHSRNPFSIRQTSDVFLKIIQSLLDS